MRHTSASSPQRFPARAAFHRTYKTDAYGCRALRLINKRRISKRERGKKKREREPLRMCRRALFSRAFSAAFPPAASVSPADRAGAARPRNVEKRAAGGTYRCEGKRQRRGKGTPHVGLPRDSRTLYKVAPTILARGRADPSRILEVGRVLRYTEAQDARHYYYLVNDTRAVAHTSTSREKRRERGEEGRTKFVGVPWLRGQTVVLTFAAAACP